MALFDRVTSICRRLARKGWADLFALHGLSLDSFTLRTPSKLGAELRRKLPRIDRTVEGFEDFSPTGIRAIEGGNPAASLLYHAFASPLVHPFPAAGRTADRYPTLEELDAIEN